MNKEVNNYTQLGVWINKDDIAKYIDVRFLQWHLKEGWKLGRSTTRLICYECR